jgi:putative (di)nucleoside polyphosphate hydrolase
MKNIGPLRKLPYRKNVGALIFKGDRYLLVEMMGPPDNYWKMPQGGVHNGEKRKEALMRELKEELGSDNFRIIKQFAFKHQYDWDEQSIRHAGYNWRGQKQSFFLVEFIGKEIIIDKKELKNYCWVSKEEMIKKINGNHPLYKGYKKLVEKLLR